MPVNQQADYILNGRPFMLQRLPQGGRAWQRTGTPDVPYHQRFLRDVRFGNLPSELDHAEMWDDWSGGYGEAYRESQDSNRYHWCENADARFPRQLIHAQQMQRVSDAASSAVAGSGAPMDVHSFLDIGPFNYGNPPPPGPAGRGGVLQIGTSYVMVDLPTGLGDPHRELDATQIFSRATSFIGPVDTFGSYTYIGVMEATSFATIDVTGQPVATTNPMPGRGFRVAGNRLWRVHGPGAAQAMYAQSCAAGTDPTITANWSATLTIGNGVLGVQDMAALGAQIYMGMADGLYAGDQSGTFYNVLPDVRGRVNSENCRDLTVFNGEVITPATTQLFSYQPPAATGGTGIARQIGPTGLSNRSPVRGRWRAVKSYAGWVFGGLYNGSQSYVMAGVPTGNGQFVWHPMQRFPDPSKVGRFHIDGITSPSGGGAAASGNLVLPNRMWAATDASIDAGGTSPLYFFPIPDGHGNPLMPSVGFSANYVGSMRMDLPAVHFGAVGVPKVFRSVEVWTDLAATSARVSGPYGLTGTLGSVALNPGIWGEVWYSIDNGPFTYLDTAATSPRATLFFPAIDGSFITGQNIALSLRSYCQYANLTPLYRAIVLRGVLRPRSVDTITAVTRVADRVRDRQGAEMRDGATMLQELRNLSHSGQAVQLVDLAGAAQWVAVLPPVDEQEVWQQGQDWPEVAATVKMAVLDFTVWADGVAGIHA